MGCSKRSVHHNVFLGLNPWYHHINMQKHNSYDLLGFNLLLFLIVKIMKSLPSFVLKGNVEKKN